MNTLDRAIKMADDDKTIKIINAYNKKIKESEKTLNEYKNKFNNESDKKKRKEVEKIFDDVIKPAQFYAAQIRLQPIDSRNKDDIERRFLDIDRGARKVYADYLERIKRR